MSADDDHHARSVDAVLACLETGVDGLTAPEAEARLARFGPNLLPEVARRGPLRRLAAQFASLLVVVLLAAAAVTAALGHLVDTVVIAAVVIINAVIGFVQEGRAESAIAAIRRELAPRATVLRGGDRIGLAAAGLVPGDVVLLDAGDRVPADLRLIAAHGLRVQESVLTGESVAVDKQAGAVAAEAPLGDRASMAWSGTLVVQGTGRGVVVATGTATQLGRIGGLLASVEDLTTPLVRAMNRFARILSVAILSVSGVILLLAPWLSVRPFDEVFLAVVAMAVAAIPEGLPAVMTIALAIGVQAMAGRNAIVRRLPAIEAIGSVSVICTDKTGTLTMNEMAVVALVTPEGRHAIDGDGYAPEGTVEPPGDLTGPALAARLCNDARLIRDGDGWRVEGDPMEGALLAFAARAGLTETSDWQRRDMVPFDAAYRFMAVQHAGPDGHVLHLKGAPERVLAMCAMAPDAVARWQAEADDLAGQGMRVLALARGPVAAPAADWFDPEAVDGGLDEGLTLLGLVGLIDPARPEAVRAVAACREAGIAVKMITGDHAGTALAIARDVGLDRTARAVTGTEIDALDDAALVAVARDCDVFARASPEHKLRLVAALQSCGLSVAMTGDGVNDAPALKQADVGVAMGRQGSEAAKDAADLVLVDDNFASLAAAVREGRRVYDNLVKVIRFELPTSFGEAAIIVLALLAGMTLPVTAVQVLWINMVTGVTLGLVLAFEPLDPASMRRPPRPRGAALVSRSLVWQIAWVSVLFLVAAFGIFAWAGARGYPVAQAQTLVMATLVLLEILNLFAIRTMNVAGNPLSAFRASALVWGAVAIVAATQIAVTVMPGLQGVFGTQALGPVDLAALGIVGAGFFALLEIEKRVRLRLIRA